MPAVGWVKILYIRVASFAHLTHAHQSIAGQADGEGLVDECVHGKRFARFMAGRLVVNGY